jgi:hypothetical protein
VLIVIDVESHDEIDQALMAVMPPAFFISTEEDLKWVSSTRGLEPTWPSQPC